MTPKPRITDIDILGIDLFFTTATGESFTIVNGERLLKNYCIDYGRAQYVDDGDGSSWYEYPDFDHELMTDFAMDHRDLWVLEPGE